MFFVHSFLWQLLIKTSLHLHSLIHSLIWHLCIRLLTHTLTHSRRGHSRFYQLNHSYGSYWLGWWCFAFTHSVIHSFTPSYDIYALKHSPPHKNNLFTCSPVHSLVWQLQMKTITHLHSLIHSFIHSLIWHSSIQSLIYSLAWHICIRPITHSLTQQINFHMFIRSLTHMAVTD